MAIPQWCWDDRTGRAPRPDPDRLEPTSDAFGTLASSVRLAVLAAVARRSRPVSYDELRATVGVEDNGRFNYHLRQLRGEFLEKCARGYELTARGEAAAALLDEPAF